MSSTSELLTWTQQKIHKEIPASRMLGLEIQELGDGWAQTMLPLEPNTNHLGTLFGGSLYVQGALSCYAALLGFLESHKIRTNNIVIAHGEIEYLNPGLSKCVAKVSMDEKVKQNVLADLKSGKRRAWVSLAAEIRSGETIVAQVRGRYLVRDS